MKKPYVIGVCGGSGSGKTSFIKAVDAAFSEKSLCVFSMDEYYKDRKEQKSDEKGIKNFDLPFSIDKKAFRRDLKKLINGEIVNKKEYTFNNKNAKPKNLVFKPAPVILIEGLFIFHYKKIAELLDLKIFIDAKENLKVVRRIKRDGQERNYPLTDVLYRYENHVLPAYEKYIEPYKYTSHIVINNNENFENGLQVVKGFINNKIKP